MPNSAAHQLFAFVVSLLALGCVAVSMEAHWKQFFVPAKRSRGVIASLRTAGALGALASLALLRRSETPTLAPVLWLMMLMIGGLLVAFALTLRGER